MTKAKADLKSEIVTIRLTPAKRARLDQLGGPAAVLRRALQPVADVPIVTTGGYVPGDEWRFIDASISPPVGHGVRLG